MTEKVVIPAAGDINIYPRRFTTLPPSQYVPFKPGEDGIPEMVKAGDGYRIHVTRLTHDEKGYPAMNWQTQKKLVGRLVHKIRDIRQVDSPHCPYIFLQMFEKSR